MNQKSAEICSQVKKQAEKAKEKSSFRSLLKLPTEMSQIQDLANELEKANELLALVEEIYSQGSIESKIPGNETLGAMGLDREDFQKRLYDSLRTRLSTLLKNYGYYHRVFADECPEIRDIESQIGKFLIDEREINRTYLLGLPWAKIPEECLDVKTEHFAIVSYSKEELKKITNDKIRKTFFYDKALHEKHYDILSREIWLKIEGSDLPVGSSFSRLLRNAEGQLNFTELPSNIENLLGALLLGDWKPANVTNSWFPGLALGVRLKLSDDLSLAPVKLEQGMTKYFWPEESSSELPSKTNAFELQLKNVDSLIERSRKYFGLKGQQDKFIDEALQYLVRGCLEGIDRKHEQLLNFVMTVEALVRRPREGRKIQARRLGALLNSSVYDDYLEIYKARSNLVHGNNSPESIDVDNSWKSWRLASGSVKRAVDIFSHYQAKGLNLSRVEFIGLLEALRPDRDITRIEKLFEYWPYREDS